MTGEQKVQLIINLCLALGSIGLLIVTLVYTLATRRMAREMKSQSEMMQKEFEIRIAPLVELKITPQLVNVLNPISTVTVNNKGFYPVKFEYIFFHLWYREKPDTAEPGLIQIDRWLEKGQSLTRVIRFPFSKIPLFKNASDVNGHGMASVELHFTDIQKEQFTLNKGKIIIWGL